MTSYRLPDGTTVTPFESIHPAPEGTVAVHHPELGPIWIEKAKLINADMPPEPPAGAVIRFVRNDQSEVWENFGGEPANEWAGTGITLSRKWANLWEFMLESGVNTYQTLYLPEQPKLAGPHSRSCGTTAHDHGPLCGPDCPTCCLKIKKVDAS